MNGSSQKVRNGTARAERIILCMYIYRYTKRKACIIQSTILNFPTRSHSYLLYSPKNQNNTMWNNYILFYIFCFVIRWLKTKIMMLYEQLGWQLCTQRKRTASYRATRHTARSSIIVYRAPAEQKVAFKSISR